MTPLSRHPIVLTVLLAALLSGCVADGTRISVSCGERILPADVPHDAPSSGGVGDASFLIRVLDGSNSSIANAAVLASWPDATGRMAFAALRASGDGLVRVNAPTGAQVRVWGGDLAWTGDESVVAGEAIHLRYPGADPRILELPANAADGFFDGFWLQDVPAIGLPVGPTHTWRPNDLPWASADRLALLESLDLRLEWRNNANAILDLANAVGRGDTWTQWNQDVQVQQGLNFEELTLDRSMLEAGGWTTGEGLRIGPALGEGGGFVTPQEKQDWHMRWAAHFAQDPSLGDLCPAGGFAPRDVTHGSG